MLISMSGGLFPSSISLSPSVYQCISSTARAAADDEGVVVERDVDCLERDGLDAVGWRRDGDMVLAG